MVSVRAGIALILTAIGAAIVIAYRKQLQATGEAIGGGFKGIAGGLGEIITKPGIALADVGGRLLGLVPGIPATPALPFGGIAAPPGATVAPTSPDLSGSGSVPTPDNVTVTPGNREYSDIQARAERAPQGTLVSALFPNTRAYEDWKRKQSAIGKAVLKMKARAAPKQKAIAKAGKKKCQPEFGGVLGGLQFA